ncbi:MAG: hypothetical protein V1489_00485 [Candidatus Liptonbacteria bacterium]
MLYTLGTIALFSLLAVALNVATLWIEKRSALVALLLNIVTILAVFSPHLGNAGGDLTVDPVAFATAYVLSVAITRPLTKEVPEEVPENRATKRRDVPHADAA